MYSDFRIYLILLLVFFAQPNVSTFCSHWIPTCGAFRAWLMGVQGTQTHLLRSNLQQCLRVLLQPDAIVLILLCRVNEQLHTVFKLQT